MAVKRKRKTKSRYGTGSVRPPRGPGGSWSIQWWDRGKQNYRGGFTSEDEAKLVMAAIINNLDTTATTAAEVRTETDVTDLLERWCLSRVSHDKIYRSAAASHSLMRRHFMDSLKGYKPSEVSPRLLVKIIETQRAKGYATGTLRTAVCVLSSFFTELVEEGIVTHHPVKGLPRRVWNTHLKATTKIIPFLNRIDDVYAIIAWLRENARYPMVGTAYAIGALAGLRTAEVLALNWTDIDFTRRTLLVQRQIAKNRIVPPKDKDSRGVGIQAGLYPILQEYYRARPHDVYVFPASRTSHLKDGGESPYLSGKVARRDLGSALTALGLPPMSWYHATRHTFASQWVMNGGSIVKLQEELGHSSVNMTQRYAKLSPNWRTEADLSVLPTRTIGGKLVATKEAP